MLIIMMIIMMMIVIVLMMIMMIIIGIVTPDHNPRNLSTLTFLMTFSQSCIFLNWLSGVLVAVWGSDFIG